MKTKAKALYNPAPLHQSLNITERFRVMVKVEGHVTLGEHHRVYKLVHESKKDEPPRYAHSVNWTDWVAISVEKFHDIAGRVLCSS